MKQIFALVLITLGSRATADAERLPGTILPEHYTLAFTPDFQHDTFTGEESIRVQVLEPTPTVTLHSAEIEIREATVLQNGNAWPATVSVDARRETATLRMRSPLERGSAEIRLEFVGTLNDRLRGFYLSRANNRKYAVTQLAATDARRAFPCFDEPAMKATFDISLSIDRGDSAISNGRVLSDAPGPGPDKHTIRFHTTPKMSTYLVAMLVGDFACREGVADGVPIRICSTPDKAALTGFALEAAEEQVRFYNRYFGIPYPFGKLDVIAVPDFAAGAMENTAAITFREQYLLADPESASPTTRLQIASVLSHEIAHMWFGDLVTMKWWDDVWLNEGFASWMANKPVLSWKPEWNAQLVDAQSAQIALDVDALRSTRPIHSRLETPDEINEAFDAIAYLKGAAVLRMLEQYVGPETFRKGVTAYLEKFAYANATSSDFAREIARIASKPVEGVIASFVNLSGAPLLAAETECKDSATTVRIRQQRFFYDATSTDSSSVWQVPVCFKTPGGRVTCDLLTRQEQTFTVPGCHGWVMVNAGASGYYRSAYPPEMVERLSADPVGLTPEERISLLEDEWALVRNGRDSVGQYLTLAAGLHDDPTAEVMELLSTRLKRIGADFTTSENAEAYRNWIRRTFGARGRDLGWQPGPSEPPNRRALRASVLFLLGYSGRDPEVLRAARVQADRYLEHTGAVDSALVPVALNLAALTGGEALYERYVARIKTAVSPEELDRFQTALTYFEDRGVIVRTLEYALSDAVRSQDAPSLIGASLANPASRQQSWDFIKSHWDGVERKLGLFQGVAAVVGASGAFCTSGGLEDVRKFFRSHQVPAAARGLDQSLERITTCVAVRAHQEKNLAAWLSAGR